MGSQDKRIIVTGGSGKAGRHVIPELVKRGYTVLNLDLANFPDPEAGIDTLKTDLTDNGQVWNAFTTHFNPGEFDQGKLPQPPVAVVHLGAIPRVGLVPDNETFRINVTSTYNVVEAACKLGVKKIIIASSETTYGVCFSEGRTEFHQLPLEEDYDVDPMDSYALSKVCNEKTARSFSRRFGNDIYALRIGNVIEPHEYATLFPKYVDQPEIRRRCNWSYIDARDLGQICDLCIQKSGLGFQVFNATNDQSTLKVPTEQFFKQNEPNTKITRQMDEFEAPLSNRKIREVLGFKEEHNWKKYYQP